MKATTTRLVLEIRSGSLRRPLELVATSDPTALAMFSKTVLTASLERLERMRQDPLLHAIYGAEHNRLVATLAATLKEKEREISEDSR